MTSIFHLMHLRALKRQPLRAALAVIAIAAGVTLTIAVFVAQSSLTKSFEAYNSAVGGPATLRVSSRFDHGGIDASIIDAVSKVDGVQTAVPLVLAVTQIADGAGHDKFIAAIGADCRAEALFGAMGCTNDAINAATDSQPPIIGPQVRAFAGPNGLLRTDLGDREIGQALVVDQLAQVNDGLVAIYPLPVAQQLFVRPNGLDVIFIVPKPGVDNDQLRTALSAAVGPQNRVVDARSASDAVFFISSQLLPFLGLISLFGLAVGAQLVFNTMTLSLEERRRELAIESAIGGTPRTVVAGVLGEAFLLGLAGGVIGLAGGMVMARPFVDQLSKFAGQTAGVHLAVHTSATNAILAIVVGIGASMLAAAIPARRASRIDIAGELVDRSRAHDAPGAIRTKRIVVLGSGVTLGLVLAWVGSRNGSMHSWQPTVLTIGVVLSWLLSFALAPALAPIAVRWIERIPLLQRGPARVAVANLSTETRRTTTVLTSIGAAVGMAFTLGSVFTGMADAAHTLALQSAGGRVMVSTLAPNNTAVIDAKISPEIEAKLASLPTVASVEHDYFASMNDARLGPLAIGSTDGELPHFKLLLGVDAPEAFARGQVMIGPGVARGLNIRPGDTFTIDGRFGPVSLVVGGVWQNPDTIGKSVLLTPELFRQALGVRPSTRLLLTPKAGTTPEQLGDELRAAHLADNLRVYDPGQLADAFTHDFRTFLDPFWLLARGLLIVAFIATASTLLLAGVKRRAEHGLLAAIGMPPGDLARMVLVEAGLFGVLGTIGGAIGGGLGLAAFSFGSAALTGLTIPFHFSLAPLLLYGFIATAFVIIGAGLPAWRTSRLDPVIALRYE
jgi:putative ABC transport system permease protein